MRNNYQSNNLIKGAVILADFILLNIILLIFVKFTPLMDGWSRVATKIFILMCNFGMVLAQIRFSTIVFQRIVKASDMLQRIIMLVMAESLMTYLLMKALSVRVAVGKKLLMIGAVLFVVLLVSRIIERYAVRRFRIIGRNSRTVTFVGNDQELMNVYKELTADPTTGYRINGYYADAEMGEWTKTLTSDDHITADNKPEKTNLEELPKLGTVADLIKKLKNSELAADELYVSLSRRDKSLIRQISRLCDQRVVRFFYVPVSVESIGISLKREMLNDMEVFTTYANPLENPTRRLVKRTFDIIMSILFLIPIALLFPFIYAIIKIQSPGPVFFKQQRTGLDGKSFTMLKFRSMHVNDDADKVQATENDPRKFPFGNFMRKSNIDEFPQFWNVLRGDMSIVGPRPHMLAHTEQYSHLIDKYMVRHFVKPGVTGWAQVTGFRGETKELWQMEGRVKRDIWYMENWSLWLDIQIIWMTAKTVFIHDNKAY